ncbi:hypothetical protein GEV33_003646 [Tenebrio molitor]|uniref:Uncharacterized protein n=1 Tax=Tenebrio molitor TaxID=7067 RepID=A0A8J6HI22_TENMO|nr:hypothetical protein GEV33_003646 [Tenebrio molitor]
MTWGANGPETGDEQDDLVHSLGERTGRKSGVGSGVGVGGCIGSWLCAVLLLTRSRGGGAARGRRLAAVAVGELGLARSSGIVGRKKHGFRGGFGGRDYYWKDYFAEVPADAVPGGTDKNHQTTYISQVYIPNHGILTTKLYKGNYYWRDYDGEIPDDAIPAGSDRNHKPTYIGQVLVPNRQIQTVRIYQGRKSVTASANGIFTLTSFIKILCSDKPEKFSWVSTTAAKLHTDLVGRHLVLGGNESGKALNIGRISYQGEVIVGKVCGYNIGDALMYFPYDNKEVTASSYEVLVYDDAEVDPIIWGKVK